MGSRRRVYDGRIAKDCNAVISWALRFYVPEVANSLKRILTKSVNGGR